MSTEDTPSTPKGQNPLGEGDPELIRSLIVKALKRQGGSDTPSNQTTKEPQ